MLTDIFGATPSNVAQKLVDGVHSPPDHRRQPADAAARRELPPRAAGALVSRAVTGGTQGVMQVAVTAPQNQARRKNDQDNPTISNKLGLHARASAKLTKLAGSFPCEVWISRGERRVNAKSIMGVMMLAAGIGSEVEVETDGEREQEAMDAMLALITDKFGEGE